MPVSVIHYHAVLLKLILPQWPSIAKRDFSFPLRRSLRLPSCDTSWNSEALPWGFLGPGADDEFVPNYSRCTARFSCSRPQNWLQNFLQNLTLPTLWKFRQNVALKRKIQLISTAAYSQQPTSHHFALFSSQSFTLLPPCLYQTHWWHWLGNFRPAHFSDSPLSVIYVSSVSFPALPPPPGALFSCLSVS